MAAPSRRNLLADQLESLFIAPAVSWNHEGCSRPGLESGPASRKDRVELRVSGKRKRPNDKGAKELHQTDRRSDCQRKLSGWRWWLMFEKVAGI